MFINSLTCNDLWAATSAEDFKGLKVGTSNRKRKVMFQNVVVILPFIDQVFIDANSSAADELGFLALTACKSFLDENKDLKNLVSLKSGLGDFLSFI